MNRVTLTFLVLLGLATLALGQLWMRSEALMAGQGTVVDMTLATLSATLLIFMLLGLGRILYRTARLPQGSALSRALFPVWCGLQPACAHEVGAGSIPPWRKGGLLRLFRHPLRQTGGRREMSRLVWIRWAGALALLLTLGLGLNILPALAHGEATLTVSPAVVAPGGTVNVEGEGVETGETFTITLEGTAFQATLGTVTVGDDEEFRQEFTIPAEAPPGIYQVRATSAEGEELTAELTIEAGMDTTEQATPLKPSAELMQLDRGKPTGQLVAIVAGLVVSAGLGLALVRVGR